ncbi:UDP-glucuronosyltransferase 2B13-like isoform X2 [Ochotona curzoniae]|uniref:UDP-glucuronosyltransferase 2B13-like isoform X2 n=1 Tax=Ochotona curzoniae TaxID=130825 RepID=UPI001B34A00B|nr:UDP-glucuronosyltransferase 2B13-like isoform X2 [Ochotona curzoniae]
MSVKCLSLLLLLLQLSCYFSSGSCGKVLVWPMEFSHWMNLKNILDELIQRGHEVTVLRSSASVVINAKNESGIKFETFPTSYTKDELESFFMHWFHNVMYNVPLDIYWEHLPEVSDFVLRYSDISENICREVVLNKKLMTKLRKAKFDVVIADPVSPGRRPATFLELVGKADMWLIRSYWDLEFPRPLLPNFQFVGGLHCKPAKPLPKDMEDFVQSSGEEGVVVFSLGSMFSNMTEDRANVIASALAQLPQKVLWRFEGKKPDTLGPNTRLYKWIPQNDILGHPKTKAFITHGGANGVFEAIYHGIPMVGIPLFGDQPDNIIYMQTKGAAVMLDFKTMSSADLLSALKTVINDPSYKENVMTLSRIHHDQPMKPLDRAVFWIEHVMRHKGAKHLRVAAYDLTWYQYHSLDVIGFLLACVAIITFLFIKSCLLIYHTIVAKGEKRKRD